MACWRPVEAKQLSQGMAGRVPKPSITGTYFRPRLVSDTATVIV
jgi:hypothetical protein